MKKEITITVLYKTCNVVLRYIHIIAIELQFTFLNMFISVHFSGGSVNRPLDEC